MKIFVTGATGFIGSHFLNAALKAGHSVTAMRRSHMSKPRIPIPEDILKNLTWLERTLEDVEKEDFAEMDVIVHLAAHSANVPYDTLEECLYWNAILPAKLVRKAASSGVRRYIIAGSCFEYGRSGERYEFIPTDAPLEPTQSYPASKAAASIIFQALTAELNLSLSILRIFQVYGEGESAGRLWPELRRAALSGENFPMTLGGQIRDFIDVEEVAAKLVGACKDEVAEGIVQIENLGSGRPQTILSFAQHWWKHWGATGRLEVGAVPYRKGEVMRYVPKI